jgi:hypothetical protein
MDWENACSRAAVFLDANSQEFKHAAELEAQRLYKVRFMKELNKGRESIREGALRVGIAAGHDDALSSIFNLDEKDVSKYGFGYAACPHCGKPLSGVLVDAKNSFGVWVLDKIRERGWGHPACLEKAAAAVP